ncbi:MAG: hypothetical protein HY000_07510 [Planctomycetes bacterium]|nr:hypothetical protein [Planctomycetota bacterium]
MVMVNDTLISAAQEGCRAGIVPDSTTASVTAQANAMVNGGLVPNATVTVSPADVSTLKTGEVLTVTVQVPYSQVSWLRTPQFLGGKMLQATCTMLREAN